jgi:hypothetical protein
MKRKLALLALWLAAFFVVLQLTNPPRTNPPVTQDFIAITAPPAPVAATLVAACYDCHSHQTVWPWYSHIAPMSWLIAQDVQDGRANLNLSEWPADNPKKAAGKMEDMSEEIGYGDMPPKKYLAIHSLARLTPDQKQALTDWLDAGAKKLKSAAN